LLLEYYTARGFDPLLKNNGKYVEKQRKNKKMKKVKKLALLSVLVLGISSLSYSYEDYYQKVYTVKVSKEDLFKAVNATKNQQKKLSKIFDEYQKKAEGVEKNLVQFDVKKDKIGTLWDDLSWSSIHLEGNIEYNNGKKPTALIERLLKMMNLKDEDTILDFFSGSATTIHSMFKYIVENSVKIKCILVQLPESLEINLKNASGKIKIDITKQINFLKSLDKPLFISEIGKERIRRAGEKIKLDESLPIENREKLDVGFKVFKLDSTNIKEWDTATENLEQSLLDSIDNIKSDRKSLDVLYEILLKYGLDLNIPIEENKNFYSIGGGSLLVSLNKEINDKVIDSICEEYKKLSEMDKEFKTTVVLRDNSFKNDVVKTNAIKKLEQVGISEIRSI